MTRLLVIGLDGATFRVIKPLCNEGELPNLSKLLASGTHGILESTFPPVTGPAWAALATGKNPGKTGIFDSFYTSGFRPCYNRAVKQPRKSRRDGVERKGVGGKKQKL